MSDSTPDQVPFETLNRRLFLYAAKLAPEEAAELVCRWALFRTSIGDAELSRLYDEHGAEKLQRLFGLPDPREEQQG
jgi:hypothetical protein